ncbi:hypothetical protein HY624_00295 [Candidatus Uhrbacteria bacterium]|nr:hypothetical protein [Candidatus Uhrbacteria bacterium]
MKTKLPLIVGAMIILIAIVIGIQRWMYTQSTSALTSFADCLTTKGAIMYGTWWCPHCKNQKDLFGKSFDHVRYVECAPTGNPNMRAQACIDAKIEGYPTWIFADGSRREREMTLDELREKTQCALPTEQK